MNWDKIDYQDFTARILSSHIENERLASTYLLTGEDEAGHEDIAWAFAAALNCEKKKKFKPCDCASCQKILKQMHPDVQWLGSKDQKSIKIEEVRDMLGWAYLKPYEGVYKVFILRNADRLTIEAANALLKTLEEAPPRTLFCLLTPSRSHLLETIQSRSFELKLRPLKTSQFPKRLSGDLMGVDHEPWEDFFEARQGLKRDALSNFFESLLIHFRDKMSVLPSKSTEARAELDRYLKAWDAVYETREALEANANQKLVLSRLGMQLKQILPRR